MKKTLSKANINNTFAHDRLTLQQVQVHVIYIQSTNNPSTSLGALCMPSVATFGTLCTLLQSVQTQG